MHGGMGPPQVAPQLTPPMQHGGGHAVLGQAQGHPTAPQPARTPVLGSGRRSHAAAFPKPQTAPAPMAQKRQCANAGPTPAPDRGAPAAAPGPAAAAAEELSSAEVRRLQQLAEQGRLRPQERERVLHHWVLADDGGPSAAAAGGKPAQMGSRKGKGLSSARDDPRAFVSVKRGAGAKAAAGPVAVAAVPPLAGDGTGMGASLFAPAGSLAARAAADGSGYPSAVPVVAGCSIQATPAPASVVPPPARARDTATPPAGVKPDECGGAAAPAAMHSEGDGAGVADAEAGQADTENDAAALNAVPAGEMTSDPGPAGASPGGRRPAATSEKGLPGCGDGGNAAWATARAATAAAPRGGGAGNRPRFSCPRVQRSVGTPGPPLGTPHGPPVASMAAGALLARAAAGAVAAAARDAPGGGGVQVPGPGGETSGTALRRPVMAGPPAGVRAAPAGGETVRSGWTTGRGEEVQVSRVALEAARARHALRNSLGQGEE